MNDDLTWMLNDVLTVPEVSHAILLSADGLVRAHSDGLSRDQADVQAAALSGLQSLSRSTAAFCSPADSDTATPWRQSMVEFDDGFVFIIAAGPGAYLAVSSTEKVDMEAATFAMHKLVNRLGKNLTSPPRQDNGSAV
ncbi:roadblock/LC7 domain-containing protein [Streptomyces sp. H27-D2]|uniref:roadblock/LC7 domain-containing protein n=1 Tax=Streptomyces sp. H27-D2 TaxID=3046304 RepID=UPI002DB78373|nr:roadblock/LC7 domain-containing protein [Streptomyces sp. H27-D2]MEC4019784.1 roadblock/LC7 domain-containing protein [Streptomyces sp. H27-D2]